MMDKSAYLILKQQNEWKEVFRLDHNQRSTIGRSQDNAIVLPDDLCSRNHANLYYEEGDWYITDLGSRNGTMVDGKPLTNTVLLSPHSIIQIGHSMLIFGTGEPPESEEDDHRYEGTGVFGVSGDSGTAPKLDPFDVRSIVHHSGQTSFLKSSTSDDTKVTRMTRFGHGSADLCRLAYDLGQAVEVDQVAKLALEGVLTAMDGTGAGLWLFPYGTKTPNKASSLRLVANASVEGEEYSQISESLANAVLDRKEAILISEELGNATSSDRISKSKKMEKIRPVGLGNNAIAAPVRHQGVVLGLLHLYTVDDEHSLNTDDLEYILAVADTVAVALSHVNRQKELAANLTQARKETSQLREMLQQEVEIIGNSPIMVQVEHLINRAAAGKSTLLVRGESGTGKELIARAVHFSSQRRNKPFVCLNCAAISESLLASELFGHEKGSFTGATDRKLGKFEAAHTGTLFLDEIGEMGVGLQAKLLRVLEGHPFERVGGNTPIAVDVRVIAATNRDLEQEVAEKHFRHDLFFRLRVLEIVVPPLRKRMEDIPLLADYFLEKFSRETGRKFSGFAPEALAVLLAHRWPGNVRELKNVIERAVVLGQGPWIMESDLLLSSLKTTGETDIRRISDINDTMTFVPKTLEEMEKEHITETLENVQWNKSLASKYLGIERTTLDRKIKRYAIEKRI